MQGKHVEIQGLGYDRRTRYSNPLDLSSPFATLRICFLSILGQENAQ